MKYTTPSLKRILSKQNFGSEYFQKFSIAFPYISWLFLPHLNQSSILFHKFVPHRTIADKISKLCLFQT